MKYLLMQTGAGVTKKLSAAGKPVAEIS